MNLIEIFYTNEISDSACGTCPSSAGCGGGCSEPLSVEETLSEFKEKYSDVANIKAYKLDSKDNASREEIATRLQEVYDKSDEIFIITSANISFIINRLNPIVAVNGILTTSNYIPTAFELKLVVED